MMKHLWKVEMTAVLGIRIERVVTDDEDPAEAIEVTKKHFKDENGHPIRIRSVDYEMAVYS